MDLKVCQVIASDKSNLLRQVYLFLKSDFQVTAFFIPLKVGYSVIIVVNFVYKWVQQSFSGHHKIILIALYFWNIILAGGLISLW